ncbi:MAG: DNA repair photolyase [Planctomycetota bacterium]|jgi:DNA repair photolyase
MIPVLTDHLMPEILKRAKDAGVSVAYMVLLLLLKPADRLFAERMRERIPERVLHAMQEMRP